MVDVMQWGGRENNLLELFERSVCSEALAQSNSTRIPNFVVKQTAKPQKREENKSYVRIPKTSRSMLWWMSCGRCYRGCHAAGSGENQLAVDVIVGVMVG